MSRGRPKSKHIFDHFNQLEEGRKKFVTCKFCGAKYFQNVTKMKKHLMKQCKNIPDSIKSTIQDHPNSGSIQLNSSPSPNITRNSDGSQIELVQLDSGDSDNCMQDTEDNITAETHGSLPRQLSQWNLQPSSKKTNSLRPYIDTINKDEQEKIWIALSKAIYVSGHPLSIFEEPLWIDAFKLIKPSLRLPSRHMLSNSLLEDQYMIKKHEVQNQIAESKSIGLQADSFTSKKSQSITNFTATTPKPYLIKSVHAGVNHHTTEYIFNEICSVIEELGPENVCTFVSDNASNVKGSWSLIEEKYPHITAFGCVAHGLNLLVEDILSLGSGSDLLSNVKAIITKIRKSTILTAQFEKIQKEDCPDSPVRSIHLPVKTRWSSFSNSLKSLLNTKQSLKRLAVHEAYSKILESTNCDQILSNSFWKKLECFYSILSPIAKWLKILEYDSMRTTSLVARIFYELELKLEQVLQTCSLAAEDQAFILSMPEERKSFSRKPLHLAAHLLDPREKGFCLTSAEELEATEFIGRFGVNRGFDETDLLTELANYKAKSEIFSKEFLWRIRDTVSGPVWWANIPNSTLGKCASMILNVSSTSVPTERSFSTYASIQTNLRNRLERNRCDKLVFLAHNLRSNRKRGRKFTRDEEDEEAYVELRAAKEGIPSYQYSKRPCHYNLRENLDPINLDPTGETSDSSDNDGRNSDSDCSNGFEDIRSEMSDDDSVGSD